MRCGDGVRPRIQKEHVLEPAIRDYRCAASSPQASALDSQDPAALSAHAASFRDVCLLANPSRLVIAGAFARRFTRRSSSTFRNLRRSAPSSAMHFPPAVDI